MKLDFGCGPRPQEGFEGVDIGKFGQKHMVDLRKKWPWKPNSLDEGFSSHFVEHLTGAERVHFFNELHRVLKKGAKCRIIVPHWSNNCAYGDPTHQWPPMSEWSFMYTNKEWRDANAPHVGYVCDFDFTYGYNLDNLMAGRSQDFQQFAVAAYRNAIRDIDVTLTKR